LPTEFAGLLKLAMKQLFCFLPILGLLACTQLRSPLASSLNPSDTATDIQEQSHASQQAMFAPKRLRQLSQQRDFLIGTAVSMKPLQTNPIYRRLLTEEFNLLTPENAMKFGVVHPERDRYAFKEADAMVQLAQEHNMEIHGQPLLWYKNLPTWLTRTTWTQAELKTILETHINTLMGRHRGKVPVWHVVNEAMHDKTGNLRESFWLEGLGSDYIELAFRLAHAADPEAKLIYNDYGGEELDRKSNAIYDLVKNLKQKGVPIHGVGFQMHKIASNPPNPEAVAENIRRLGALGLNVYITEMDVQIHGNPTSPKLEAQSRVYRQMLEVCLKAPNCKGLMVWGLADHLSWIPYHYKRPDAPLLFDTAYKPKPAYEAIATLLKTTQPK
jgi:endo-1,4-beta-xylanase